MFMAGMEAEKVEDKRDKKEADVERKGGEEEMKEEPKLSIEIEIRHDRTLKEGNIRKIVNRVKEELDGIQGCPQVKIIFK